MHLRFALIISLLLLALAGSAQARQSSGHRRDPAVLRLTAVAAVPAAPASLSRAPVQRTHNVPVQLSHMLLDADLVHRIPQKAWDRQDAAYSLWRNGTNAMDDGEFRRASENFHKIHEIYPASTYAAESWYWEAFSLYRSGGEPNLKNAVAHLDTQQYKYPRTPTASDGLVLATRLRGELAVRYQNSDARRALVKILDNASECSRSGVPMKIAALSAFRQIDPFITVKYLSDIFERPSECSSYLRQQAVFILAQVQSPEAADILINLAASSRQQDVRKEAVQWIADIRDDRAIGVLERILLSESSFDLKETALFSLSQLASSADAGIFRSIARSRRTPVKLRVQAVNWLAEQQLQDQSAWIVGLYREDRNPAMREAVVTAIAAQRNIADRGWLLSVGRDTTATLDLRKRAITAAAELFAPPADLYALYHQVDLVPLREQIIDLLGRNREKNAIDRLIDIAVQDSDSTLRTSSLKWLRQSKDPKAVEFLIAYRER